jgi:hypothetical protein
VTGPGSASITQGKTTDVTVSIKRTGFTDAVKLSFGNLPKGVTVDSKDTTVPKDETKTTVTLKAADDADEVSDHKATVTAEGGGKKPEPATFTVKVVKK